MYSFLKPILEESRDQVLVIGIDGPTAAGKTIFADNLAKTIASDYGRPCWIYRLDWQLAERAARVNDLKNLFEKKCLFPFEGEWHMHLSEFGDFLRRVRLGNSETITLENLYSRADGGHRVGRQTCALKPGLVILAEGHYTLRTEFRDRLDASILLLGDKGELLARKIARVEGYRGAQEAEEYFWRVDLPSFQHHLKRFGSNADWILDNTDYRNPKIKGVPFLAEWLQKNRSVLEEGWAKKNPDSLGDVVHRVFSPSQLVDEDLRQALRAALDWVLEWDQHVGLYLRNSIENIGGDLTSLSERLLESLNTRFVNKAYHFTLRHTNALYNVYNRSLPITIGLGLEGKFPCSVLVDVFHDFLRLQMTWGGGYHRFHIERELGTISHQRRYTIREKTPEFPAVETGPARVITPTLFTIPAFLKNVEYEPAFSGHEEENICASQALMELANQGGVWIHRFAKFSELNFFLRILESAGGQGLKIGNYLIAVRSGREGLLKNFRNFCGEWRLPFSRRGLQEEDEARLDAVVNRMREEVDGFIEKNCPDFEGMDGYLFCSKLSHDPSSWKRILKQIETMLACDLRLMRKRAVQFIQKYFPDLSLKSGRLWDDLPPGARPQMNLDVLTSISPSILAEVYLWLALRDEPGAILGANIYDIRKNSSDVLAYLETAAASQTPVVLQGSLNALGQKEKENGSEFYGYLQPKNGAKDLVDAGLQAARDLVLVSGKAPPLFGIGLDHVDAAHDRPKGRARHFLQAAMATECVTHFTLDGSPLFSAKDNSREELERTFCEIAAFAAGLLKSSEESYIFDKEICSGELNYLGAQKQAMVPSADAMELFTNIFQKTLRQRALGALNTRPMLFVGNLGTTHHGSDQGQIVVEKAKVWRDRLKKYHFVSAVLHGTTGTHPQVLAKAAAGCHKINVAGDFLGTLIKALPKRLQTRVLNGPQEPKKKIPEIRSAMDEMSAQETAHLKESLKAQCRAILDNINTPQLSTLDVKYFRYKNFKFTPKQVTAIVEALDRHVQSTRAAKTKKALHPEVAHQFSASMIEVPFDEKYRALIDLLWEEGVRYFHVDVGDGKFVSRKFSGLEKTQYLRKNFPEAVLHGHLMVENPHLPADGGASAIEQYLRGGLNAAALHRRAFSQEDFFFEAVEAIRKLKGKPGLIIETSETLDTDLENLIRKAKLEWVVVMGVPVGFGGQIFDMSVLKTVAWFHQFAMTLQQPFLIEVDGGLNFENLPLCKRSGAQIFSGWSIVKGDTAEEVRKKVRHAQKLLAS